MWGVRRKQRGEDKCWRGAEYWKVRIWQGVKPDTLQTGDLLKRLTTTILRPTSLKLWAGSECDPDSISRSVIVSHSWGCLGTTRVAAWSKTEIKPFLRILIWFQVLVSNLSFFSFSPLSPSPPFVSRCSKEGESKSTELHKGHWLMVWVRKIGIRLGLQWDGVSVTLLVYQVNYQRKKILTTRSNLLRIIKGSINAFDQSSHYDT